MAVLIQPIVDADCAGVCFSVDPVAHKRGRIVINSAWGLGAGVANGSVPNDTDWLYRHDFSIEKRHIVVKDKQLKLDGSGQTQTQPVAEAYRRAACLPQSWLVRVAQFAIALENLFGSPQDVEWAIAGKKLWILQSRPIQREPPKDEVSPSQSDPAFIKGIGASPGLVTGRARIMSEANELPQLQPGDILVAHNVGPLWTPIFPMLAGLVLDSGSIGQHAAATAREYGITAVVATGDASLIIPDKSLITVDGRKRTVQIQR